MVISDADHRCAGEFRATLGGARGLRRDGVAVIGPPERLTWELFQSAAWLTDKW
jgi:hypothetical protein